MNAEFKENSMELWRRFAASGRIADYLNYRSAGVNGGGANAAEQAETAEQG